MYQENVFTKIINGEIPCDKVYETEHTLMFNDISPKAPVHILAIPKGCYAGFSDFSANAGIDEITDFYHAVSKIAGEKLPNGYRIIINSGTDGGQEVPHFHAHILGGMMLGSKIVEE